LICPSTETNPLAALEHQMMIFGAGGIVDGGSAGDGADVPAAGMRVGQWLQMEKTMMRRTIHRERWTRVCSFHDVSVGIVDDVLVAASLVRREERRDVAGKC
jgi:hypothetical protein